VVDESWVLPALIQLGGTPVVTDEGDIVYEFNVMQHTPIDLHITCMKLNHKIVIHELIIDFYTKHISAGISCKISIHDQELRNIGSKSETVRSNNPKSPSTVISPLLEKNINFSLASRFSLIYILQKNTIIYHMSNIMTDL